MDSDLILVTMPQMSDSDLILVDVVQDDKVLLKKVFISPKPAGKIVEILKGMLPSVASSITVLETDEVDRRTTLFGEDVVTSGKYLIVLAPSGQFAGYVTMC